MWRNKSFQKHINKRIELKKLGLPKGVDPNAVIFIMDKVFTLDGIDLKTWEQQIGQKILQMEDQQNQFFSTVGNADKGEEKQGDGLAHQVTPELRSTEESGGHTRNRKQRLLEEAERNISDPEYQKNVPGGGKAGK